MLESVITHERRDARLEPLPDVRCVREQRVDREQLYDAHCADRLSKESLILVSEFGSSVPEEMNEAIQNIDGGSDRLAPVPVVLLEGYVHEPAGEERQRDERETN